MLLSVFAIAAVTTIAIGTRAHESIRGASAAYATPTRKGNIIGEVNYNSVLYSRLSVCDQSTKLSSDAVNWAIQRWNNAIGQTILTADCSGTPNLTIYDTVPQPQQGAMCQAGALACTQNPWYQYPQSLTMYVVVQEDTLPEQDVVAVHEVGHALGFAHWFVACGQSIMETCEDPLCCNVFEFITPTATPQPQLQDITNYSTAYSVDPPVSVSATSPAPGQLNVSWDPSQIFNEGEFAIWIAPQNTSNWSLAGTAAQDASSKTLTGLTPGPFQVAVGGWTGAYGAAYGGYGGKSASVNVNIMAPPLPRPANFKIDVSDSTHIKLTWSAVSGANHYEVQASTNPANGTWYTPQSVTGTSLTLGLPGAGSVLYYAVRAVDVNGVPSLHSSRGATLRFDQTRSGVLYRSFHTVYKNGSGSDIFNAFNKNNNTVFLGLDNHNNYQTAVVAVGKALGSTTFNYTDQSTGYGPVVYAIESPSWTSSPKDEAQVSLVCFNNLSGCD